MCNMLEHDDSKRVNAVAKRTADDLIAKKRALKAAPKVKDSVDALLESISKIKDRQLLGANNPALVARSKYGTSMHKSVSGEVAAELPEVPQ
jgi:hypothetical protein